MGLLRQSASPRVRLRGNDFHKKLINTFKSTTGTVPLQRDHVPYPTLRLPDSPTPRLPDSSTHRLIASMIISLEWSKTYTTFTNFYFLFSISKSR